MTQNILHSTSTVTAPSGGMWYVYILKCADGTVYTGCTKDPEARLKRHIKSEIHYTKSRLPLQLISYFAFTERHKAYAFEKYLKSGSGKAFARKRLI